jgi:hypothetical protein
MVVDEPLFPAPKYGNWCQYWLLEPEVIDRYICAVSGADLHRRRVIIVQTWRSTQDEEDEMFAVFATVLIKSMNNREKLDGEKKRTRWAKQWIVKLIVDASLYYSAICLPCYLSYCQLHHCFKATPINPECSGVLQYQLENIHCFNTTHKSTGFQNSIVLLERKQIHLQIIEISHLINYKYQAQSPWRTQLFTHKHVSPNKQPMKVTVIDGSLSLNVVRTESDRCCCLQKQA